MIESKDPISETVLRDLQDERKHQLTRGAAGKLDGLEGWSYDFDDRSTPSDWAAYVAIYLGRAVETAKAGPDAAANFRKNMVKVAALAVAAVEAVDRNGGLPKRHFD